MTQETLIAFGVGVALALFAWKLTSKFIGDRVHGYEELQREYDGMKTEAQGLHAAISTMSDKLGEFTIRIRTLEGENQTLREQVARLQAQQDNLISQINRMQGRS